MVLVRFYPFGSEYNNIASKNSISRMVFSYGKLNHQLEKLKNIGSLWGLKTRYF